MISVIVPVYKVESYLRQCIDSILCQTYQNLEIILIDDGSPDKSGDICEEYAKADTRIRVFHTENKGLSATRNLGLREAKGEYIGFVDSDDWIEPDMYEKLLRRMEETGTSISICGFWNEYLKKKSEVRVCDAVYSGTDAIRALVCDLTNGVWNKLFKKEVWTGIRFPEKRVYEDIATLYKVVLSADCLSCTKETLYHYRRRQGSIIYASSSSRKSLVDHWYAYYDKYSFLINLPEIKNDHETIDCLEKQLAFAAVKLWVCSYMIPKNQRDYDFLHKVSVFVQNHFPLLGKKEWKAYLRISVFFTRHANDVSFAILYTLNSLYYFLKNIVKKPFPS